MVANFDSLWVDENPQEEDMDVEICRQEMVDNGIITPAEAAFLRGFNDYY